VQKNDVKRSVRRMTWSSVLGVAMIALVNLTVLLKSDGLNTLEINTTLMDQNAVQ